MNQDIRWHQRFGNFDRALGLLREALANGQEKLSPLEQEGAAQRLEYTLELAWKCMKDYLEDSGVSISPATPRQVIKEAFYRWANLDRYAQPPQPPLAHLRFRRF